MEIFVWKLINMTGSKHDAEIVSYGLYAIIDGLETIIVIMLLGAITNKINTSVIYLLMSFVGTGTMGGYHCSSRKCCMGVTIMMWGICALFSFPFSIGIRNEWILLSLPLLFILVYILAPVQHRNKPLSKRILIRNRKLALVLDITISFLIILLMNPFKELACVLWILKLEIIISMMIGKVVNRNVTGNQCESTC